MLVHIQANLDQDLSLEVLAKQLRLSQFHFHRLFRSAVGETLKQYTQRLRLERAANRLLIHDATILDVALDSGSQIRDVLARVQTPISSQTDVDSEISPTLIEVLLTTIIQTAAAG